MEVILLEKVGNIGNLGDKVEVKSGFGRNFLVPFGKAVPATAENVKQFEERRAELEAAAAEKKAAAEARAQQLAGLELVIEANASEEGKLFGSIGPREIADAVSEKGIEVAKSEVAMPEGVIRETGEFELDLILHSDVTQTIRVIVNTP